MRSGSTLLNHLLMGHPQVIGCGERNATIRDAADLHTLAVDAYYRRRRWLRRRPYVTDQINHSRFLDDPAVLGLPHVRTVFLIRRPEAAIASMAEVFGRHYGMTLDEAMDYYEQRLVDVARLAEGHPRPELATFVTFEALVETPDTALRALSTALGLVPALTPRYRTYGFTGGSGDPSPTIHERRVVAPPPRRAVLPADRRAALEARWSATVETMTARCATIVTA